MLIARSWKLGAKLFRELMHPKTTFESMSTCPDGQSQLLDLLEEGSSIIATDSGYGRSVDLSILRTAELVATGYCEDALTVLDNIGNRVSEEPHLLSQVNKCKERVDRLVIIDCYVDWKGTESVQPLNLSG
jgi:hypothetical protein